MDITNITPLFAIGLIGLVVGLNTVAKFIKQHRIDVSGSERMNLIDNLTRASHWYSESPEAFLAIQAMVDQMIGGGVHNNQDDGRVKWRKDVIQEKQRRIDEFPRQCPEHRYTIFNGNMMEVDKQYQHYDEEHAIRSFLLECRNEIPGLSQAMTVVTPTNETLENEGIITIEGVCDKGFEQGWNYVQKQGYVCLRMEFKELDAA
jgi:hypothetical protein